MNAGKAFFDTNVLLYMYSSADAGEQLHARELYREYSTGGRVVVSTQVIQEFYVAALRKLALPRQFVREIPGLESHYCGIPADSDGYEFGRAVHDSFWDALIIAAAQSAGAEVLFTEDLNHGQRYGSVVAQNLRGPAVNELACPATCLSGRAGAKVESAPLLWSISDNGQSLRSRGPKVWDTTGVDEVPPILLDCKAPKLFNKPNARLSFNARVFSESRAGPRGARF